MSQFEYSHFDPEVKPGIFWGREDGFPLIKVDDLTRKGDAGKHYVVLMSGHEIPVDTFEEKMRSADLKPLTESAF
ncbi:hypothetical protein [Salinibacter altiplanensis]|uniref:hypothetical protein n=1 Tax=Salinibacter altiplanensis TaxID=1803181 RepID=UPI000C9F86DB|nr:hypothetical protein [Salinibacter altiplanensis]